MEFNNDRFTITTDKGKLDVPYIHEYLKQSYWGENIPQEVVQRSIDGALCFGIFENDQQVGFARVITDFATFAYLADVFVDEACRGLGLSKWLMEVILSHPDLQGLRRFMLATRDAHGLYQKFGFVSLTVPERWMQIHNPNVYKKRIVDLVNLPAIIFAANLIRNATAQFHPAKYRPGKRSIRNQEF